MLRLIRKRKMSYLNTETKHTCDISDGYVNK